MSEMIQMPNNIYEALLLQLIPLISGELSSSYNNVSFSGNFYDYEDDKACLKSELWQSYNWLHNLHRYVIQYFGSVYDRIKKAPMGLNIDTEYGVPVHKVFECLVAAEVHGNVVGGKNDGGIDVIGENNDIIYQCKSGNSHTRISRTIYKNLIQSCIENNMTRAVLAVTDAQFPDIRVYPNLQAEAQRNELNIELKRWQHYDITHECSPIDVEYCNTILEDLKNDLNILLRFLEQLQKSIGKKRQTIWDNILKQCINDVINLPKYFENIESDIHDNLSRLESEYENDDSMRPWEKAYIEGFNGLHLKNDSNSEDTDNNSDDDAEDNNED